MNNLIIGTSSFSEADWVGNFYPPGTKPGEFLTHYAEKYPAVEIDATYYAVPALTTVQGWDDKTPAGFTICAKFPKQIVHGGDGPKPDPEIILQPERVNDTRDRFLEVMSQLGEKLGPLVLQFPYFNKSVFPNQREFYTRLDLFLSALPTDFRYVVEIRNKWWLKKEILDICKEYNVALALTDQAWMPMIDEIIGKYNPLTTNFNYIRLLGDRQEIEAITTRWNKEVIDRSDRLQRWLPFLNEMVNNDIRTYIFVNNHYAGHAPATIAKLQQLLRDTYGY
ncbi:DUF72 domain-containing protein [Calditrichota bacterium]